jgi:hypothetical protein
MKRLIIHTIAAALATVVAPADTTLPQSSAVRRIILANPLPLEPIGELQTRSTAEIDSNPWSIGCETLGRGFADFDAYKDYLPALGAKRARIQSAWFRCEEKKGVYTFDWLDHIVDGLLERDIKPWVTVCYGNPIYRNGGTIGLSGGLPHGDEGLAAWDAYVAAMASHFKDRVGEWEIWNEPDISRFPGKVENYADLLTRSSKIIKGIDPGSKIFAFGLAGNTRFVDECLPLVRENGGFEHIDAVTCHVYNPTPEKNLDHFARLRRVMAKHQLDVPVWQGENGAPSTNIPRFALRNHPWTELSQAKWFLRRMAADRRAGIKTNIFTIADLNYRNSEHTGGEFTHNCKGLLDTDKNDQVVHPKASYYAVQNMITLFDDKVLPVGAQTGTSREGYTVGTFMKGDAPIMLVWDARKTPGDSLSRPLVSVTVPTFQWQDPVLVDLLSGTVHELPKDSIRADTSGTVIDSLPVGDYPTALVERTLAPLAPDQDARK